MTEESKRLTLSPVLRCPPWSQLEVTYRDGRGKQVYAGHTKESFDITETLFITPVEFKLWERLVGILSPSLWEAKASGVLQRESGVITFSGPPETVLRAKEAVSKLLIMVRPLVNINLMAIPQPKHRAVGFFHLWEGLDLFLWEGEASGFRVDAVVRISTSGSLDFGNAVFAQRVWSQRGGPQTNLDLHFSHPTIVELAAGAVKLALEAASQKGLQSLVMSFLGTALSTFEAQAIAAGIEAFKEDHPASPLKSVNFISSDRHALAVLHEECEKHWPLGKSDQVWLRHVLLSLEAARIEVAASFSTKKETDVAVVPLVLNSDMLGWGPDAVAITRKVLESVPDVTDLRPGEVLPVMASAFPEFGCRVVYLIWLGGSQLRPKDAHEAIKKMFRSCLSTFYGSFLESISFPAIEPADPGLAVKGQCLRIMLEEIHQCLKELPNPWMKLLQIVPLPGRSLPCPVEDYITTAVEPVGLCCLEDPLFLQYLNESPDAFRDFEVPLEEVGYGIQICSPWRMLAFKATSPSMQLHDLRAAFQSVREKYLLHCETRTDVLEALLEQQTLVTKFRSIRIYIHDRMWFVGLFDEMASFLQCLLQVASQRQVVSWEFSAEPLAICTIARDSVLQEMLPSNPLISIEILTKAPATIRFWGRQQRVEEAERRFKELLNGFQVLPVPLSNLQSQFIKVQWGKFFHNGFFLEKSIPAVLEISEVVQVVGLDSGKMKEAEEIIVKEVCERTVEIAEELKWATECAEWKELLHSLGSNKEVALHHIAPSQVTLVGLCPHITQAEGLIKKYLRGNSAMEERMKLDTPELALAGNDLLCIMDWKHLKVKVRLQRNHQILFLQVSGLQKYVTKAMPAIKMDLDSLVLGTMPLRKKALGEYFSGVGAGALKKMAQQMFCIAKIKNREITNSDGSWEQRFHKKHPGEIYAVGRQNHIVSLKQAMAGFIINFQAKSICNEAIATFSDKILNELCQNTLYQFPIGLRHLCGGELQICGSREDVGNVLEAIDTKIVEYQGEWIEVNAQYKAVPCIIVKECLVQEILPGNHLVSTEIVVENPATVIFRGPRQKVVELERCFEEVLSGFQILPAPLSDLQSQFVKAQWGKLFHKNFFLEQGILAVLEISEVVQVAGLDLDKMKAAEEILVRHVCERTVEVAEELKWATECEEWEELLDRLGSHKEVALHHIGPSRVTVVGICPYIIQVEESIKEYLEKNSSVEEKVNISRPELAFAGEGLLSVMDWDHLKVGIQVQPNSQLLSLQVSGLRKFVHEAIQVIEEDLDYLVLGTIPLEKKSLGEYFSGAGAGLLQEMAQEQNCIAKMQIQNSGPCDGVISSNGNRGQELAKDHSTVIQAVGRKSDVASFKQDLEDFISKFHEETICNAEISTFSDEVLKQLCENTSQQFPVTLHRLREKVVWVCGSHKDVEKVLGAIYTKIEEAALAKIQEVQAGWIESKLLYETVRWHHMTDAGWSSFDMDTNRHLEIAYSKKGMGTQVLWDGQKMEINLLKGQAFMPRNRRMFRIRREICLWDKNIAPHWEAMDGCLVKKVELQTSSEEYQDIVKNFKRTTDGCTVLRVERIQNRYLWVSYCWKRSWMEKKNPEGTQNERILYHGTWTENWYSIHEIGFKSACRSVGIYGQGIYFAVEAGRAAFYAKPDPQGHRYMFQARVLTGEFDHGNDKMVLPPIKQGGKDRYDSLVDVLIKPTIFVTFFDDHAYPEYLITFSGPAS
ncbi:uncharacterized protein LOC133367184 [Rhineura floridana]|uniref:uncharacterized protein LOC133367184 n=1 Tax=Rhineura floridana TaxID=261503 RepID=UPI002AC800B8|nr:uncharacterized protein LOC133367184 [Rhineura floridana]XP_061447079.1 uncharacterized protein LOC133367184 [Rhineura floridana]